MFDEDPNEGGDPLEELEYRDLLKLTRDLIKKRDRLQESNAVRLAALNGLMGLMQLICARPDMPQEIRQAVQDNHRWRAANEAALKGGAPSQERLTD